MNTKVLIIFALFAELIMATCTFASNVNNYNKKQTATLGNLLYSVNMKNKTAVPIYVTCKDGTTANTILPYSNQNVSLDLYTNYMFKYNGSDSLQGAGNLKRATENYIYSIPEGVYSLSKKPCTIKITSDGIKGSARNELKSDGTVYETGNFFADPPGAGATIFLSNVNTAPSNLHITFSGIMPVPSPIGPVHITILNNLPSCEGTDHISCGKINIRSGSSSSDPSLTLSKDKPSETIKTPYLEANKSSQWGMVQRTVVKENTEGKKLIITFNPMSKTGGKYFDNTSFKLKYQIIGQKKSVTLLPRYKSYTISNVGNKSIILTYFLKPSTSTEATS